MNVTLYKYYSEKNRIDKSGYLQLVKSVTGEFKADTSILSPTLFLALPNEGTEFITDESGNEIDEVVIDASSVGQVLDFNYFYVAEFRRYYFVTSIVVSSKQLIYVTGSVDPLYSFKDDILVNNAMVERNEFTFDAMLEDSLIPLQPTRIVTEENPTNYEACDLSFSTDLAYNYTSSNTILNIVVCVADDASPYKTYYGKNTIQVASFLGAGGLHCYAMSFQNYRRMLTNLMTSWSSYNTFFSGAWAYPYLFPPLAMSSTHIKFLNENGEYDTMPNVNCYSLTPMSDYRYLAKFYLPAAYSFLDLNPYTRYEIYIPFYGWYELQYNSISNHPISVFYSVNYSDGSAEVYVYDELDQRYLLTAPCQLGTEIAISSSNAKELINQKEAATRNAALGGVGAAISVIAGIVSENPFMIAGGITGAVGTAADYVNKTSLMFNKAQSTHNGSVGALYSDLTLRLRITRSNIINDFDLAKFAHQYGRPLRQVRQLSTLSGYTQVSKVHLENCPAFDSEKAMIESSLLSGVIL